MKRLTSTKSLDTDPSRARSGLRKGVAAATVVVAALTAACSGTAHSQSPSSEHSSVAASKAPKALGAAATSKLIFVSNRSGKEEIYEKDLPSLPASPAVALTSGSNNMNPELSPDGKRLVFYSDRSGNNQIDTLSLQQPGNVTQLTFDTNGVNNYDPTFTPDGHILYKKSDTNGSYGNPWEMNGDGSGQHPVTTSLTSHHEEGWKPTALSNDQAIITVRQHQGDQYSDNLFGLDLATGQTTQLTNNALSNWYPAFSQETGEVVFVTKQQQGGHDVLSTMLPNGEDRRTIVAMPGDSDDPSWVGGKIVFINHGSGQYDVYDASSDGTDITHLDQSPAGSDDLSPLVVPYTS